LGIVDLSQQAHGAVQASRHSAAAGSSGRKR
jgi:hypothetical protein